MAKVKYHLIKPEVETGSEERVPESPFKILLLVGSLWLIALYYYYYYYYNVSEVESETLQTTQIYVTESYYDFDSISTNTTPSILEYVETDSDPTQVYVIPNITESYFDFDSISNATPSILEYKHIDFDSDPNYFVKTSKCRMPVVPDVLKNYKKRSYTKCDTSKDLITLNYNQTNRSYSLHQNEVNLTCCYKQILRSGTATKADNQFKLLPCSNFHQDFVVPKHVDGVITECRRLMDTKLLQQDAFGFVQPKELLNESFESKPSVLLWGIDSMSRMNFKRTMPQMHKYLKDQNWFELRGYNKVGDNTFPNLMAVLTGFNLTRAISVCRPMAVGGLDACPFMWKNYKAKGYATAFAEDWTEYSTFNHMFKGFRKPPTDYYGRPLVLAVEKTLKKKSVSSIPYCVGRRHFAEYIYDAALQFTQVYKDQPSFGMFWTNSFSHNNYALPSAMDVKILEYMVTLQQNGVFEKSIVIFFSDHGMRFGELRVLKTGYLEERMPMMYIWLPQWFRDKHPEYVQSLRINRNRLTSPYDIYATLQHILQLETPLAKLPQSEGCPSCHSVFHQVAESRDCKDAGIDDIWCTCYDFGEISVKDPKAILMGNQLVAATNNYLAARNLTEKCQKLKLTKIESVQRRLIETAYEYYVVRYDTQPANARFEASVKWNNDTQQIINVSVPSISRMTAYQKYSHCVHDAVVKKYCICGK